MATAGGAATDVARATTDRRGHGLLRYLLPPATILVLLLVALLLLLTPIWVHAAIDFAGGKVPGGDAAAAYAISDRTVGDLLLGGSFAIELPGGAQIYTADEASHLSDVRLVLYAFLGLAALSAALLVIALRKAASERWRWRSVARGGAILLIGLVVLGIIGVLAFGLAFEVFHRLLFPGGNFAFGPDSNLISLYPYAFWQLSAAAFGGLAAIGAGLVWVFARRRALEPQA